MSAADESEDTGVVHLIPVYQADGLTEIGEFQVGG